MRLDFLESDRFWRGVLWAGISIFLLTRLLTIVSFPIFNDEAIYVQYSQVIHEDFAQYRLLSAGNNMYGDWKPPLQYWIGSAFVGSFADPLLATRLAAFFVSLFGLLGVYLLSKEILSGKKFGALAVLLYALCPPVLFFNIQFVAETFVFSFAPWMYWFFLRALRPGKVRLPYALAAAFFGGLVLLSKQSGMVYLYFSLLLPLLAFKGADSKEGHSRKHPWDWSAFFVGLAVIAGGVVVALALRRMGISADTAQLEKQFNGRWLMTVREIFALPWETWKINFISIWDYYRYYYSFFIVPPILFFFYSALRKWNPAKAIIGLGFLGGSAAVLLLLRGFNEYIYNTAVIVFLVPLLAISFFAAWDAAILSRGIKAAFTFSRSIAILVLVSFVIMLGHWVYQDVLMKISPADYIRRSTPWAIHNYLENWSGGFGVAEAFEYLGSKDKPILAIADPQWGNPRTALEVYAWGSRDMQVFYITSDFRTPDAAQQAKAYILEKGFKNRFIVFSAARNEERAVWQDNVLKYFCDSREDIQVEPTQPPIVICSF